MVGMLDIAISAEARCTIEARQGRIEALATFERAAWGVEGERFVDLVVDGVAWLAREAGVECLEGLAETAWRHWEYETAEARRLSGTPQGKYLLGEIAVYVSSTIAEGAKSGAAYRRSRQQSDRLPTLMELAVRIYTGTSGPYPRDIAVDILADLHHWCAGKHMRLPDADRF